ncbi:MAG: VanZ family protein [Lachnospiraceae bacterium]|nr:VanZ family protein [Lachnospiraceae bacterium]
MVRLVSLGIDVVSSIIFVIPAVFIIQYAVLKQRCFSKTAAVMIFAFYLIGVFSVVGIPSIFSWNVYPRFNLIPLIDIVNSPLDYLRNTILNILLFIPLGFLLPAIWKKYRSLKIAALAGLSLSLFIEILQIFTFRLTDVDDLITNTAGCVAGYYIGKWVSFKLPWKLSQEDKNHYSKYEPAIIFATVFLIGFCLKPVVSNYLWKKILSSSLWNIIK